MSRDNSITPKIALKFGDFIDEGLFISLISDQYLEHLSSRVEGVKIDDSFLSDFTAKKRKMFRKHLVEWLEYNIAHPK